MAAGGAGQGLVLFEEVAVSFSPEEWALLTAWQRDLYQEVMEDNFELVASLGSEMHPKPAPLCRMKQGEELYAVDLPGQEGEDARGGGPLSAAWSPSVQDPAIKEESSGHWSPLAAPESRALGVEFGSLQACPNWSGSKVPDVGTASGGPRTGEAGGGSPEHVLLQICECGQSFEEVAMLREHQALHEEEKGPFVCTACGKLFQYQLNLLTHKKHRGKKPHPCAQCGVRLCLKGDLLRHRASHAAEGLHPCGVCGLLFRHKRHLLTHQAEHSGGTPHRCPTCGTAFGSKGELASHQRSHQEERPFVCSTCGESFSWRESLQVHQRTHAQDRGHACPVCGKTFSRQGNLLTHQRLHTGELPFSCPECDRSFPSKASLGLHSRFHRRGRPLGSRDKPGGPLEAPGAEEGSIKQEAEL